VGGVPRPHPPPPPLGPHAGAEHFADVIARWERAAAANLGFLAFARRLEGPTRPAAERAGALILAVGFEAGMWDVGGVISACSQACVAVLDIARAAAGQAAGGGGGGAETSAAAAAAAAAAVRAVAVT